MEKNTSDSQSKPIELPKKKLRLEYVRLETAVLWDRNPKTHDIPSIIESIQEYGFRDPPEFDGTLDAIVEGNGRTTALNLMYERNEQCPGYCFEDDDGTWIVPIIFGADSESVKAAEKYAVDHNLLTLGQPRLSIEQVESMFRAHDIKKLFSETDQDLPISLSSETLQQMYKREGSNDITLDNFDESLAEGFAHTQQFSTKVQLIVDLTEEQANNVELKEGLKLLSTNYGLKYRIKTAR
jgi:hypothetical protein